MGIFLLKPIASRLTPAFSALQHAHQVRQTDLFRRFEIDDELKFGGMIRPIFFG